MKYEFEFQTFVYLRKKKKCNRSSLDTNEKGISIDLII